jgi:hypothetical protein
MLGAWPLGDPKIINSTKLGPRKLTLIQLTIVPLNMSNFKLRGLFI